MKIADYFLPKLPLGAHIKDCAKAPMRSEDHASDEQRGQLARFALAPFGIFAS
jgi:hypothetical protein